MFNDPRGGPEAHPPGDRVLDVDGGVAPFPRADGVVDIEPFETHLERVGGKTPAGRFGRATWYTDRVPGGPGVVFRSGLPGRGVRSRRAAAAGRAGGRGGIRSGRSPDGRRRGRPSPHSCASRVRHSAMSRSRRNRS